jgi:hypothetical protein
MKDCRPLKTSAGSSATRTRQPAPWLADGDPCGGWGLSVNINPKTTRRILAILAAAVAALVVFHLVTREEYEDSARRQIQRET